MRWHQTRVLEDILLFLIRQSVTRLRLVSDSHWDIGERGTTVGLVQNGVLAGVSTLGITILRATRTTPKRYALWQPTSLPSDRAPSGTLQSPPTRSATQLGLPLGSQRGPPWPTTMAARVHSGTSDGVHGEALGIGTLRARRRAPH